LREKIETKDLEMLDSLKDAVTLDEKLMFMRTNEFILKDNETISRARISLMNRNTDVLRASTKLRKTLKDMY
jgi:hypothetical protein